LFILTSLYEGLGNVFIDAVNHEVPCIYTNCKSGPNEILLKNKSAGANATGKKLSFPEKINNNPIAIIKKIIKYFLYSLDILFPKKK